MFLRVIIPLLAYLAVTSVPVIATPRILYVEAGLPVESQMNVADATYVIRGKVDLQGKSIQLPTGCTLSLKSGKLVNGTLVGANTKLKSIKAKSLGVNLTGNWYCELINDSFFDADYLSDDQIIANINAMQSDVLHQQIFLEKQTYKCHIPRNDGALLLLRSNTALIMSTSISIEENSFTSYNIIRIMGKENVSITGGELRGDVGKHSYSLTNSSQWGHGINIHGSKNITVSDITITRCIGDGIAVSGGKEPSIGNYSNASSSILLKNVIARYNRRQGLSIIHASDVVVENCVFSDTGVIESHSPSAGIDVEPNTAAPYFQAVRNVTVSNCVFERNVGYGILSNHYESKNGISSVENVVFSDCITDSQVVLHTGGVLFKNTKMQQLSIIAEKDPIIGCIFSGCTISGGYGVQFYCPNSGRDVTTKIGDIVFENCSISVPSRMNNTTSKGIFWCKGRALRMRNIMVKNCRINIPQEVPQSFNLLGSDDTSINFENSRISIPGRFFPADKVSYSNCRIISRNVNE